MVFVCSLSDFFHADVPLSWVDEALEIMDERRDLTFLLLTKRPQNIDNVMYGSPDKSRFLGSGDYIPNVWIGITAENQLQYNIRIGALVRQDFTRLCPIRFASCEPLLGHIDLQLGRYPEMDWIIVGGESGVHARTMKRKWAVDIQKQCADNKVSYFYKQQGRKPDVSMDDLEEFKSFPNIITQ